MQLKSYAKINLSLNITGVNEDNYHLLDMVNLPLELGDLIDIEVLPSLNEQNYITCDYHDITLGGKFNIVYRTIMFMRMKYNFHNDICVQITKLIPISAGLGGGSSNAGCVMKALYKILKIPFVEEEAIELASQIGADVPFFLFNKPKRVKGIGEILSDIKIKDKYYIILLKTKQGLSTKEIYELSDTLKNDVGDNDKIVKGLATGNLDEIKDNLNNSLLNAASSKIPEINSLISFLKNEGLTIVNMSGSGPTVFGLSKSLFKLIKIKKKAKKLGVDVIISKIKK